MSVIFAAIREKNENFVEMIAKMRISYVSSEESVARLYCDYSTMRAIEESIAMPEY